MASVHDGHRERMRNKYFNYGLEYFEPHKMLEMLLFFSRQQGNTNPLAHKLLDRFGSLQGVFTATTEELLSVDGVGEHTAMLLSMIYPIYRQSLLEKTPIPKSFNAINDLHNYLKSYFLNKKNEEVIAILLDNSARILKVIKIGEGSVNRSPIDFIQLSRDIVKMNASGVVLSHNHPKGQSTPSRQDVGVTIKIRDTIFPLGCNFIDHIIVGENSIFSFSASKEYEGYLSKK